MVEAEGFEGERIAARIVPFGRLPQQRLKVGVSLLLPLLLFGRGRCRLVSSFLRPLFFLIVVVIVGLGAEERLLLG